MAVDLAYRQKSGVWNVFSELVIATYQKPEYLKLALSSLRQQTRMPDRVCIADDGSDSRTKAVLSQFCSANPQIDLRHVWHEDTGFRKTRILNDSVRSSTADYLIFIDDDCLMHPRFIERHLYMASRAYFLTGSVIRLSDQFSQDLLAKGQIDWTAQGRPAGWQPHKLSDCLKSMILPPQAMGVLDQLSPVRKSWAGGNASTFRDNIFKVNGFDETMAYGGEDKEFGARLINSGVLGCHLRYSAPLYHLEHARSYVNADIERKNRQKIIATRKARQSWTEYGLIK